MHTPIRFAVVALAALLAACDSDDDGVIVGPGGDVPGAPERLDARYEWILEGFNGTRAVGQHAVRVTWALPGDWDGEPFRVYAKPESDPDFTLIATVTNCSDGRCRYTDINVTAGETYDYYVTAVDERSERETASDVRIPVFVPEYSPPAVPTPDSVVALDDALFVPWRAGGATDDLARYQVYLVGIAGDSVLFQAGETDGTAFVDARAANGTRYTYRIAAVDTLGQVSGLSASVSGIPRPDRHAELVYAFADSAERSGFRFPGAGTDAGVVSSGATAAQWRLVADDAGYRIEPLGATEVVEIGRITELACAAGSDPGCIDVDRAPEGGYVRSAIPVSPEYAYAFRVAGADGRTHYGVIRVRLLGTDQAGRRLMIFDWAYQLQPEERRLNRVPA